MPRRDGSTASPPELLPGGPSGNDVPVLPGNGGRGGGRGGATGGRDRRRRGLRRGAVLLAVTGLVGSGAWLGWRGSLGSLPLEVPLGDSCTATANGTGTDVTPERAGNAAVIAAIAVRRGLPARAATIGIATAIQESKLENIDYGDRDSLGLFQQRPSQGWGTPEQVRDPVYATNAFYDGLVKVDGWQSLSVTVAAQEVQRSGFPTAYADHEPEARLLASALAGYSPAGFTCSLGAPDDALPVQSRGRDGLTPRARGVVTAAAAETGRRGAPDRRDAAGTTATWTLRGGEARRLGWALASWAVARADSLHVVAVETDGRRWSRGAEGWTAVPDGGTPGGRVRVTVAAGGTTD